MAGKPQFNRLVARLLGAISQGKEIEWEQASEQATDSSQRVVLMALKNLHATQSRAIEAIQTLASQEQAATKVVRGHRGVLDRALRDTAKVLHTERRPLHAGYQTYQAIRDAAVDAIIVMNADRIVQEFSVAAENLFGYTAREVIGKNVKMLMPPITAKQHDGYVRNYQRTGEKKIIGQGRQVVGRHKTGKPLPLFLSVGTATINDTVSFVGILRDDAEQLALRQQIETASARNLGIIETSLDCIFLIDGKGSIQLVNNSAIALLGYSRSELLGKNIKKIMPPDFERQHDGYLEHHRNTGQSKIIGVGREVPVRTKSGKEIPVFLSIGRIEVEGSTYFAGILRDLSVEKTAIANLEIQTQALSEQNALNSALVSLTTAVSGKLALRELGDSMLRELCPQLGAQIATFYAPQEDGDLRRTASYAYPAKQVDGSVIRLGEGLVGQAALEKKSIFVTGVAVSYFEIRSGLGAMPPRALAIVPLIQDDELVGILEFGTVDKFSSKEKSFLAAASPLLSAVISAAQSASEIRHLLQQSNTQTNALQAQKTELSTSNEQLEQKTRRLKASEEELFAQGEELREANQELVTRAEKLEIRTQAIEVARGEIQEQAERLALTSKYKSEFLANMSHELRTPLNSVLILANSLSENANGNLTEKQVQHASTIHDSGKDLLHLIGDILDLAKIESGAMGTEITEVSFYELGLSLERSMGPVAAKKNLAFSVDVATSLPATLLSDVSRVQQVLKNLLSNALKFTSEGTVSLTISVATSGWTGEQPGLSTAQTVFAFCVRDTGVGIPPEHQNLIFEAFQQGDGSTSRRYGGTGLGLSISRQIAQLLGGELRVQSQPGEGSEFTFYLPNVYTPLAEASVPPDTLPLTVSAKANVPAPETRPTLAIEPPSGLVEDDRRTITSGSRVILIVEDDPRYVLILRDFAREQGFLTLIANRGKDGLALATRYKPNAITLDIHLPDTHGLRLLDTLKHDSTLRHIPVQVHSVADERMWSLQMGAIGFLKKPANSIQLKKTMLNLSNVLDRKLKRLLVVEDNATQRESIRELVGTEGTETEGVSTGQEALKRLSQTHYDCMVLDLKLPDMTGFEVLDAMAKIPALTRIPVIVYTGHELTRREERALRGSAEAIIVKGADSPERLLDETALFLHRVKTNLPEEKQETVRTTYRTDRSLAERKLLLVDDDPRNLYALTAVLELQGLSVVHAENGQECLEVLEQEEGIDVILMDIMMPIMDGYEAIRAIREIEEHKNLPIIALTAKAMKGDRERCIDAGASDYMTKPVDEPQLLSLLRVWAGRSR